MLSKEDNELLTRTNAGTPAGDLNAALLDTRAIVGGDSRA